MSEFGTSRRPSFQPRFTLGLFYLFGMFFLFAMLFVAPEMLEVLQTMPTGPEQEQAVAETVRAVARPRLAAAFVAALATVLAGAKFGILPGLRPSA